MKLRDFIRLWLIDGCKKVQASTREFYTRHAGYATAYIGDLPLEIIDERAIEIMQGHLHDDGLSARSINHVKAVLRNAFNVAMRWNMLTENPANAVPEWRVNEDQGHVLTPAQVAVFLHAVEGHRHAALYHVALVLGPRRGELLALRLTDVDGDILHVEQTIKEGEGRKPVIGIVKSRKARDLPLSADLSARLEARRAEDAIEARIAQQRAAERATQEGKPIPIVRWNVEGLLFCSEDGTPLLLPNFNRNFRRLVARINKELKASGADASLLLPVDLSPHDLRKTALTDLATHGEAKAVQEIAGHADIDTTMRLYVRRRMTAMRAAVEEMEKGRKTG